MFTNALDEQFWISELPSLECLDGAWMIQGVLRNEMVAGVQVLHERGIEAGRAGEAGLLDLVAIEISINSDITPAPPEPNTL